MEPWFSRSFPRGLPIAAAPELLMRLRRTADRLAQAVAELPGPVLVHRPAAKWSIQEHAGHLLDLEQLWDARLDDFERGAGELRPADLTNRKTHDARHNERALADLLDEFRRARAATVQRLEAMDRRALAAVSLHPRLRQPMSVVDLCFFVAEHDDHHLGRIVEIGQSLRALPAYALDLANTIDATEPLLLAAEDERTVRRPAPGKWSPREVIGHLIDSASNNHQRFVRAMFQSDLVFAGYTQDQWVESQRYQDAPWRDLVTLWASFNRHLSRVMITIPEDVRLARRTPHNLDVLACHPVPASEPATLDYFMNDYVWHLHHHLRQIPFLQRPS
jgi:uncharacterized damage-inducible protein DinB